MSQTVALRLLWKEYRWQRALWLSLVVGMVAFQCLCWASLREPMEPDKLPLATVIAHTIAICYAVAAGAITFAPEREDGTDLRLVILACPPGATFVMKAITGIGGSLVLWMFGLLISTAGGNRLVPVYAPHVGAGAIVLSVTYYGVLQTLGFLWGMLCSLVLRNTLWALLMSCVLLFTSAGLASVFVDWMGIRLPLDAESTAQGLLVALVPILLGTNYVLARKWLSRGDRESSWSSLRFWRPRLRLRREGTARSIVLEFAPRAMSDQPDVESPVVALSRPVPSVGLRAAYALRRISPGSFRRDSFLFLAWRDARATRMEFLALIAIAAFVNVARYMSAGGWDHFAAIILMRAPMLLLIVLIAILAGILSFRREQVSQDFRFLSTRGISWKSLWWSKQCVWLVRLFILGILPVLAVWAIQAGSVLLRFPRWSPLSAFAEIPTIHFWAVATENFVVGTLGYVIGQTASLLVRRTVLATVVAFLLITAIIGWARLLESFRVPIWVTSLPPVITLLWIARLRCPHWFLERKGIRCWIPTIFAAAAGLVASVGAVSIYRVLEIPPTPPIMAIADFRLGGGAVRTINGLTEAAREEALRAPSAEEQQTSDRYRELLARLAARYDKVSNAFQYSETWDELDTDTQATVSRHEETVRVALELAHRPCSLAAIMNLRDPLRFQTRSRFHVLIGLVALSASRLAAEGETQAALQRLVDALAMCRQLAHRGDTGLLNSGRSYADKLSMYFCDWASKPGVTKEQIDHAIESIVAHQRQLPGSEPALFQAVAEIRKVVDSPPRDYVSVFDGIAITQHLMLRLPGEHVRFHRFLDAFEVHASRMDEMYRSTRQDRTADMGGWLRRYRSNHAEIRNQVEAWRKSTPLLTDYSGVLTLDAERFEPGLKNEAAYRATVLRLRLVKWFKQHRRYSEQLIDAVPADAIELLDPWTGQPFGWFPNGLPKGSVRHNLAPHQPFLVSYRSASVRNGDEFSHGFDVPQELTGFQEFYRLPRMP